MAKNKVFVGSAENNTPIVEEALAAATITPANLIVRNAAGAFILHDVNGTMAAEKQAYFAGLKVLDGMNDAYASGETVFAHRPQSGETYHARVATGQALVKDTPLTSNGAGLLKVATLGTDFVVCYSDEVITTSGTTFVRVKIA